MAKIKRTKGLVWLYGLKYHFQPYFSYIVAVSFLAEETGENHRPVASH